MTEAERAADYYRTRDDDSQWGETEPMPKRGRLDVTISVRFTHDEIAEIRRRADAAGMRPTTYIRDVVLEASEQPLNRDLVARQLESVRTQLSEVTHLVRPTPLPAAKRPAAKKKTTAKKVAAKRATKKAPHASKRSPRRQAAR